jgi:hypothetical protein
MCNTYTAFQTIRKVPQKLKLGELLTKVLDFFQHFSQHFVNTWVNSCASSVE